LLKTAIRYRYVAAAVAVATLMVSVALLRGGRVGYVFLPESDSETVVVDLAMPIGTPAEQTRQTVERIEQAAAAQRETRTVASVIGQVANLDTGAAEAIATHRAQMFIELHPVEQREKTSNDVVQAVRSKLRGQLDGIDRIGFSQITGGPAGADITVQVRGRDPDQLRAAAQEVKEALRRFEGVHEIADDDTRGQVELQIRLRDGAAALGLSTAGVSEQVRGFLYGLDAHVYAQEQEDIKVRVHLAEADRKGVHDIESAWVIAAGGRPVPLSEVADLEQKLTYATIKRLDRQRVVQVTADTSPNISPEQITSALDLDSIQERYPKVQIKTGGRQEQQRDAFGSLPYGFAAALLGIYVILAWLFSSYTQPAIVLLVVPFGFIGVIWGHLGLGYDLTFLSLIGFVALSGIVVNDSLILVKFYNEQRAEGLAVPDALLAAGRARLRAILLTTITTVLGLTPLMLEQSFQARFLIPMAISIAVGLLAATVLVLVVVPCFLMIGHDLGRIARWIWMGRRPTESPELASS
ncbi:MAG: efflux RND transporter permease subunit, partial [Phycisphaeraceae bacterium]|nr:efflux RND transporter permease subunit [Phycisphaeraceae bacterium]